MKKYELTEEAKEICDRTLYRIMAVRDFGNIRAGDIGGWIEKEENLSQKGDCWVSGDAWVFDNARVYGDAQVHGDARVRGDAQILNNSYYIVFKNWWSSGRYFTWTRSNDMWSVGGFYGTGEELIAIAYRDSERSGREYERIVKYVEEIKDERI